MLVTMQAKAWVKKNTWQKQEMGRPPFYWQLSVVPKYNGNCTTNQSICLKNFSETHLTVDEAISYYKVQSNQLNTSAILSAHMR